MDRALTALVWRRAGDACEYCKLPQRLSSAPFEIDHVIARQHGGRTLEANLALSCFYCNRYKGPNIAGRDPRTRKLTPLFNPRRHKWTRHFRYNGPVLVGLTPIGRTTIAVLQINDPDAVALREALIDSGLFPP